LLRLQYSHACRQLLLGLKGALKLCLRDLRAALRLLLLQLCDFFLQRFYLLGVAFGSYLRVQLPFRLEFGMESLSLRSQGFLLPESCAQLPLQRLNLPLNCRPSLVRGVVHAAFVFPKSCLQLRLQRLNLPLGVVGVVGVPTGANGRAEAVRPFLLQLCDFFLQRFYLLGVAFGSYLHVQLPFRLEFGMVGLSLRSQGFLLVRGLSELLLELFL